MKRCYRKRLLLIEGEIPSIQQVTKKSVTGALLRVSGSLQIPIVRTASVEESAQTIERLAIQLFGFAPSRIQSQNLSDPQTKNFYELSILAGFPNLGMERAKALLLHFGSLSSILVLPKQS